MKVLVMLVLSFFGARRRKSLRNLLQDSTFRKKKIVVSREGIQICLKIEVYVHVLYSVFSASHLCREAMRQREHLLDE